MEKIQNKIILLEHLTEILCEKNILLGSEPIVF